VGLRDPSARLWIGRKSWRRVALGILVAVVASVPALLFLRSVRTPFQGLPWLLVVIVATLLGGRIAGVVAVLVAVVALDWYVFPPEGLSLGSGAEFWSIVGFVAVMLVVAQLVSWLEAVGNRERLERDRAALLVRIGDAMASAVGQERALREVARILVPSFADWAVVHLLRVDGSIARVAVVHAGGEEHEQAIVASREPDPADEHGVASVIRSGRTERFDAPEPDQVGVPTADQRQPNLATRGASGSSIVTPLIARERTIGSLTVARSPRRPAFSGRDVALIEEIGERSALVVDNLRLVDRERRSAGLTAVLQELTAALSAAVAPADVGRTVVEQGARALAAAGAVFAVRAGERVEVRESFGRRDHDVDALKTFSIDDPLPLSQAMRTGRAVVLRSIEERDRLFPALRAVPPLEDHALVSLPFVVRGSAIGGLALTFEGARVFEPWELAFMESIAAQAGQALDRARLFASERDANARLETSADRLERLLMVAYRLSRARGRSQAVRSIVEVGARAADASSAALMIVDRSNEELVVEHVLGEWGEPVEAMGRIPLSAPSPGAEAARTGHPVWLESPEEREHAFPSAEAVASFGGPLATAAVPLVVGGRTLAVLALGYGQQHAFDEDERDFVLTLAGLCAQNLQGALVLEQRESARAEAERAREQIGFLAEATRVLSSSLDFEATIAELADLCVPRIADWLNVVIHDGRDLRQLAMTHIDRGKLEIAERLQSLLPFDPDAPTGVAFVLRTGESELVERVDDEMLKAVAPDAETLEALRELHLSSAVTVPLVARDRVSGAMTLAYAESGRQYRRADLTFIESLARRAAVAMDNARLFRDRADMSRALQRSLLPRRLPSIPGVELAVRYIPFGEGHDVGGDFYDAFSGLDDSWGLLIGDVCGKGPEAASIVGIARHTVRGLAAAHSRPSTILEALNRAILDESPWDRFCTACYVRLRPDGPGFRATVALGGHLPPIVVSPDGSVRRVGKPGSLLGVLERPEVSDIAFDLLPGELLLMYTDGLEDPGRTPSRRPSVERLLARSAGRALDVVVDELLARFRGNEGVPPRDDVAILAVRVADPS
jgi:GAF domain-containing protein